jgi:(p)ppGpp synthase/HD superfamily hydrolase
MSAVSKEAMRFATREHIDQLYGGTLPYIVHCAMVHGTLKRFLQMFGVTDDELEAAAWLHDYLEDGKGSLEDKQDKLDSGFGPAVYNPVWCVTGVGRNRKEKNKTAYAKIAPDARARKLKIADRISNVEHAWERKNSILFMYYREYRSFRGTLRPVGGMDEMEQGMWDHLDGLMGWWDPTAKEVAS